MRPPTGRAALALLLLLAAAGVAVAVWYLRPEWVPVALRGVAPPSPHTGPALYKWRDANGALHVTDTPPPDRPYETVRYDPNANVVPNVKPPGTEPKKRD